MVVNEIDESNSENNRTIDTETLVYLKTAKGNIRESIYSFIIRDGGSEIFMDTIADWDIDEDKKIKDIRYLVDSVHFKGPPGRKGYKSVIRSLLSMHGMGFRASERNSGYTETVEVSFGEDANKKIVSWEDTYV